ncbi:MAG TPA: MTH938/NDUFAF3 family protein [Gemmataceae bacterium]|nr:MTH938/NDUFAF3 family protein [Gemmataceae bacterium]
MSTEMAGLLLSDDLIFTSRIATTAQQLGLSVTTAKSQPALEQLAARQPARCVILDLANPGLDIAALLGKLRQGEAPPFVVAYGAHVDTATLRAARAAGCDIVLPRSKFAEELAQRLPEWFAERRSAARSPRITHISWGRMEVQGVGTGRDFKLYPGGGRAWDWTETDTHHVPGIQPADVEELLEKGSQVVVLTRGMQLVLQTCPETLEMLRERGIAVHVEETRAAVELYNRLAETQPVGGLFHSTC